MEEAGKCLAYKWQCDPRVEVKKGVYNVWSMYTQDRGMIDNICVNFSNYSTRGH